MSLPMIERREIEADILKEVYDTLRERHGEGEARRAIHESVRRSAIAQGRRFRDELGREPDLEDFHAILDRWKAGDALRMEVHHVSPDRLSFDVTRCRYAEMYHRKGLGEIGHLLSCNRDGAFCEGYGSDIVLTRTQTIMQGADHCDFRYKKRSGER